MAMRGRWRRSAAMAGALAGVGGLMATVISPVPVGAVTNGTYRQTNLVSDIPGVAPVTDPNLVNPWGMSEPPGGPLWVSNNNSDTSTLYTGAKAGKPLTPVPLTVAITGGAPTGQVFNGTGDFVVHAGSMSGPARFIFASENGDITGWNPNLPPLQVGPPPLSTESKLGVSVPDAVYKGLAMGHNSHGNVLYAANFRTGHVDEFDGTFNPVNDPKAFQDPQIPPDYAPFNVYVPRPKGPVYVTYAQQNALKHDDVSGAGHGFIDVFTQEGKLTTRLVKRGALNSPWGMVIARAKFGKFHDDLLVANFGDGTINAFDPETGALIGSMVNPNGKPIAINGLWGLIFGDASAGHANTLFFSAGIADEAHGLLGTLSAPRSP